MVKIEKRSERGFGKLEVDDVDGTLRISVQSMIMRTKRDARDSFRLRN